MVIAAYALRLNSRAGTDGSTVSSEIVGTERRVSEVARLSDRRRRSGRTVSVGDVVRYDMKL